jgi:hypothetical protein
MIFRFFRLAWFAAFVISMQSETLFSLFTTMNVLGNHDSPTAVGLGSIGSHQRLATHRRNYVEHSRKEAVHFEMSSAHVKQTKVDDPRQFPKLNEPGTRLRTSLVSISRADAQFISENVERPTDKKISQCLTIVTDASFHPTSCGIGDQS